MRLRHTLMLALVLAAALPAAPAAGAQYETRQAVTVKADGTVHAEHTLVYARTLLEQQVRVLEQMKQAFGGAEAAAEAAAEKTTEAAGEAAGARDADAADETPAAAPEIVAKTDADEAFARKVVAVLESHLEESPFPGTRTLRSVDVTEKTVTLAVTVDYETLSDFVAATPQVWNDYGFRSLVIDTDEEGRLRLALGGHPQVAGVRPSMRARLKSAGYKAALRLTLPGKIVSSTFPETDGATTGITVDAADEESLEAYLAFFGTKQVVVCEPGALALDGLPLDSSDLAPTPMDPSASQYEDVPVTGAGEGFIVEALGVTTRTVHVFEDGVKRLGDAAGMLLGGEPAGCQVKAKLYTPPRRRVLQASGTRVLEAVDDKGRKIPQSDRRYVGGVYSSGEASNTADLTLNLALPAPDAQAIQRIRAETIAVTFADWKEHVIRNVQADPETSHDLGDLVPGAKLVVNKIAFEEQDDSFRTGVIRMKLTGPPAVQRMAFEAETGTKRGRSHEGGSSQRRDGDTVVRELELRLYGETGTLKNAKIDLRVKMPDDLKRERVPFTVEAVDLY